MFYAIFVLKIPRILCVVLIGVKGKKRLSNRAEMCDITSVMKSLPWGKTLRASYGKKAFLLLHVC